MPLMTQRPRLVCWGDSLSIGVASALSAYGFATENQGIGGETSTQIATRMLAKTAWHGLPTLIWAGRNNFSACSTVLADVASMVAALEPGTPYLVLSILNGEHAAEYAGGTSYTQIIALNAALAAAYPGHYGDVRSFLVGQANPSVPQDLIDAGHDIVPSALRVDAIHLSPAGYGLVAGEVARWLGTIPQPVVNSPVTVVDGRVGIGIETPQVRAQIDGDGGYGAVMISNAAKTNTRMVVGISGGPSQIVNGDVLGDAVLMVNGRLHISTNNGGTISVTMENDGSLRSSGFWDLLAMTPPTAPMGGRARLYVDTVSGKNRLMVRFHTGDPIVIAAE